MSSPDISAKAGQYIVIKYPYNQPERLVSGGLREVTLTTEQAVELYNDLRHALYD